MSKTPMIDFIKNIDEPTAVVYQRHKKAERILDIKSKNMNKADINWDYPDRTLTAPAPPREVYSYMERRPDDTVSNTFLAWLVAIFIVISIVAPAIVMIYMFHCSLAI